MRRVLQTPVAVAVLALGVLPLAGCGAGGAKVKGQVQENGQPYNKLAEGETMSVGLKSSSGALAGMAGVGKDGSFSMEAMPVPPGAYRVELATAGSGPGGAMFPDKFNGAFSGPNDPLKVDIGPESTQTLEIDVGKKTVTKK